MRGFHWKVLGKTHGQDRGSCSGSGIEHVSDTARLRRHPRPAPHSGCLMPTSHWQALSMANALLIADRLLEPEDVSCCCSRCRCHGRQWRCRCLPLPLPLLLLPRTVPALLRANTAPDRRCRLTIRAAGELARRPRRVGQADGAGVEAGVRLAQAAHQGTQGTCTLNVAGRWAARAAGRCLSYTDKSLAAQLVARLANRLGCFRATTVAAAPADRCTVESMHPPLPPLTTTYPQEDLIQRLCQWDADVAREAAERVGSEAAAAEAGAVEGVAPSATNNSQLHAAQQLYSGMRSMEVHERARAGGGMQAG